MKTRSRGLDHRGPCEPGREFGQRNPIKAHKQWGSIIFHLQFGNSVYLLSGEWIGGNQARSGEPS